MQISSFLFCVLFALSLSLFVSFIHVRSFHFSLFLFDFLRFLLLFLLRRLPFALLSACVMETCIDSTCANRQMRPYVLCASLSIGSLVISASRFIRSFVRSSIHGFENVLIAIDIVR